MCRDVCIIACVCVSALWVLVEWKSISHQGLYCIICVIYCTICLQGNITFKDWGCLQDYTISKELSDPPPEQWNGIYLSCYLSYVYALFPLIYLGICILAGDYSKRRLCVCHNAVYSISVLHTSSLIFFFMLQFFSFSSILHFAFCLLCATDFFSFLSTCRWINLVKQWTTLTAPSPS